MPKIEPLTISYKEGQLHIEKRGITSEETRSNTTTLNYSGPLPDLLSYLQRETELTRKTLADIISQSNKLDQFIVNPQKYMDEVAALIKSELYKVMINGIKYEKIADLECSKRLFEDKEILGYLNSRLEVHKSVYDAVVYDSEIERKFAEELDKRDDIKLFVKLPSWFVIETPVGEYNPDWAIVKYDEQKIYLVRETKGTKDFLKLRNSEADKVRCGKKHFESLAVDMEVVTSASEV
jgi:type III restriction enzyme